MQVSGGVPTAVDVSAVMAALSERSRADIVRLLGERHRSQRGLSQELGMSQPLVSHHLKVLAEVGLVESSVCERIKVYQLRPSTFDALAARVGLLAERAAEVARHQPC
ncbi:MAG TPA: winged helix-turn-helix domain-containing protein [Motilibacteraceae bacterium]|nr:winged helix-turn-helix domain-containing protein [Motilibacteraceae bacterium]